MDWKLPKGIIFCLGIVALVIAVGTPVFAVKPAPIPQLIIQSVIIDSQTNRLQINGGNLNNGNTLAVTLAGTPLTVITSGSDQIVASIPSTTLAGTYRLSVVTGTASTQSDEFTVAISAPNGITRAVHGIVGWNGDVISGTGFSLGPVSGDVDAYPYSARTGILFDEPFTSIPSCTASAYPSSTEDYVTAVIISVISNNTGLSVHYQQPVPDYPYSWYTRSGFTFICVE
jgi:hypothetical protein